MTADGSGGAPTGPAAPGPWAYGPPSPPPGAPWVGPPGPYQPGPYPPASYAPGPQPPWSQAPPPRRRRSRWLTIGLPVAGGLLLFGGCGAVVVAAVHSIGNAVGPARSAADSYARALVAHRWDEAHQQLCARDRAAVSSAELAAHYLQPPLTGYRIDGVNVSDVNGQWSAQVSLVLTTADGPDSRTTLPLVEEGSAWHPCP